MRVSIETKTAKYFHCARMSIPKTFTSISCLQSLQVSYRYITIVSNAGRIASGEIRAYIFLICKTHGAMFPNRNLKLNASFVITYIDHKQ